MNTKHVENPVERKKLKRAARMEAPAIGPRPASEARGSNKKKVKVMAKGQSRKR
jgi:hypothetical protein